MDEGPVAMAEQKFVPMMFSTWMRLSTGAMVLAISSGLRTAFSGSAKGRFAAYFMRQECHWYPR